MDLIMRKYYGWEFKPALTTAIHKMASDLSIRNVNVQFKESIPTAAINRHGQILITNIKDDAVMSQLDLQKFTGFGLHELLHRKFTDFDAIDTSKSPYLLGLHNAIEDAFIENRAVRQALTGNVQGLLGLLIDTMATKAMDEVTDWSDPSQYPFALAVYARKHGQVRVPLAKGLRPIFDEACSRLERANGTADTWKIAEWVYKQLMTQPEPPTTEPPVDKRKEGSQDDPSEPPDEPTEPSNDEGEGDPQDEADEGTGEVKTPRKPSGKDVKPRSTEPDVDVPAGAIGGGSTSETDIRKQGYHVGSKQWTISI
jgi:hypothetical protein